MTNNISLTKKRVIDELFTQTQRKATANVNTASSKIGNLKSKKKNSGITDAQRMKIIRAHQTPKERKSSC